MPSQVDIVNAALNKIGAGRITSFQDDTVQARAVLSIYDMVRDKELAAHRWSFAMKRVELPLMSTAPAFGFSNQFELPADYLRLDMINDQFPRTSMDDYVGAENLDWQLEGNLILTDFPAPLKVRYIARVTDVNVYDPCFNGVLAARLALELCEVITQSNEKKAACKDDYRTNLIEALRKSSIERPPVAMQDDAWIFGRI